MFDHLVDLTEPRALKKYHPMKTLFDLSDADVVKRSKYEMSFKCFFDMAPEESVRNLSLLTKFRKIMSDPSAPRYSSMDALKAALEIRCTVYQTV